MLLRNRKTDSNYSSHLLAENQHFDFIFEMLLSSKKLKLDIWEILEVNKHKGTSNLLNDLLDLNRSPFLISPSSLYNVPN